MKLLDRRGHVAVGVVVVFGLAACLGLGQYVVRKHLWAEARLEQIEPQYARLVGLRDARSELAQHLDQARAAVAQVAYPASRNAGDVGNELQQATRRTVEASGLGVVSSQVLAPRSENGIERIAVAIQVEGSLANLQLAMAALQAQRPRLALQQLTIRPLGAVAPDGSPAVSGKLTIVAFRVPV